MTQHDRFVITEESLFKHLFYRNDLTQADTLSNINIFLRRIPTNIFKDEYHVFYDAISQANKFDIVLTYDFLHQILMNNMQEIMRNPQVTLYQGGDITEVERRQNLLDHLLAEFDNNSELELEDDSPLAATLEFYISTWCKVKMEEIIQNQLTIVHEGMTVGRRLFFGVLDAKAYYDSAYGIVRSLMDGSGDVISSAIDTSTMTPEEIQAHLAEDISAPEVTRTGIDDLDNQYQYRKGEIITIQAGTGVGKTRYANAMVYHSRLMGKNVLYLTLEQKSSRVIAMQQARHIMQRHGFFADISDKHILRQSYGFEHSATVSESLTDLVVNETLGKLRVESINLHASEVESLLINVWENGFHFDVVVIDYLGLILTSGLKRYDALTDVVNMLKSNVKSFKGEGFLCMILNQLTKDAEKSILNGTFESGKNDGSETQYLGRASDYIYTLVQRAEDKRAHKVYVYVDKVRLGDVAQPKVAALAHLGHCYFANHNLTSSPPASYDDD